MRASGSSSAILIVLLSCGSAAPAQDEVGALVFNAQNIRPRSRPVALEDAAKGYDFDGLVQALGENDHEHQYYAQFLSGGGSPNSRFHMMLRDCRIAKLRSYIQAKPAEERAATAEQLFDTSIEAYDAGFQNQVALFRGQKGKIKPFLSRHDAALAMLLLCGEFCEPESVLQKADYYKAVVAKQDRQQAADKDLNRTQFMGLERQPDAAFLNNLYLSLLEQRFPEAMADADLRLVLGRAGQNLLKETPILYWDLKTNAPSKTYALRSTCQLLPEFEGMGSEEMQAWREKRIRAVVDRYVVQQTPAAN